MCFLSMWMSSIIALSNSNGKIVSLGKIPVWIFTSAQVFPPAINLNHQFFMDSVKNFKKFVRYLGHFYTVYDSALRDDVVGPFDQSMPWLQCFASFGSHRGLKNVSKILNNQHRKIIESNIISCNHNRVQVLSYWKYSLLFNCSQDWTN